MPKARPAQHLAARAGSTGDTIHTATASISTPKKRLTDSIQAPARGSSEPAEIPTNIKGMLMPTAMENSALPPITTSRLWPMYSSAPASGAATQGPTISAEIAPITNTPTSLPADCWSGRLAQFWSGTRPASATRRSRTSTATAAPSAARSRRQHPRDSAASRPGLRPPGRPRRRARCRPAPCPAHRCTDSAKPRAAADLRAFADDDGREDRQHRQHAGRERQQQAQHQEQRHDHQQLAALQRRFDAAA